MAKLYFRYAAMSAGKSTQLLQIDHNYRENAQSTMLWTAGVDDRYGRGYITSRLGPQRPALLFDAKTAFAQELDWAVSCVLIDEAQFLSVGQVQELHAWAHRHDVPVMCFGLRSTFQGLPFEGSAALLALADDLEELKTVCLCGKKATMNIRLDERGHRERRGAVVGIGGNDRYRSVCARCFYAPSGDEMTEREGAGHGLP